MQPGWAFVFTHVCVARLLYHSPKPYIVVTVSYFCVISESITWRERRKRWVRRGGTWLHGSLCVLVCVLQDLPILKEYHISLFHHCISSLWRHRKPSIKETGQVSGTTQWSLSGWVFTRLCCKTFINKAFSLRPVVDGYLPPLVTRHYYYINYARFSPFIY